MNKLRRFTAVAIIGLTLSSNIAIAQSFTPAQLPTVPGIQSYKPGNLIQADIQSQRIPAGTSIRLRIENPVNTLNSRRGDQFIATIMKDIIINNNIVLPSGTIIRGRVGNLKASSYLSRGGELSLNFDHAVTPMGRQIPVSARIVRANNLSSNGTLGTGGGYLNAVERNLDRGVDIVTNATEFGIKTGKSVGHGVPMLITVPVASVTGVAAGSTVFFVKSLMSLIQKGDNVRVNPGDIIEVSTEQALDIPVN